MTVLSWPLAATIGAGALGCLAVALSARLWLKRRRRYESSASVADAYDRWTNDQLLERVWGDHIHLGYYHQSGSGRSRHQDFRVAKETFVHELARWSGLDQLPPGSTVLDVGCGNGGSAAEAQHFAVFPVWKHPKTKNPLASDLVD